MAQIPYSEIANSSKTNDNTKFSGVSFFSLKNDGEEAFVKFMEDKPEKFEILSIHTIKVKGKERKINCLRENAFAPVNNCPLCAAGYPVIQRFYIKMVQYAKDVNGNIVATPKVWERSKSYATQLHDYMSAYNPLSAHLFMIKRQGAAGSTTTRYNLLPLATDNYPENQYPYNKEEILNYHALGGIVLDKSANDINYFLANNDFPQTQPNTAPGAVAPQPDMAQRRPTPAFNNSNYEIF